MDHSLKITALNIHHRVASPLESLVESEARWKVPTTSRELSLKIGVESSQIVLSPAWCSKLRLTTEVKLLPCHDEFRGPRSHNIDQVT
ncbi:hypothetical protein TNCV_3412861 [Trichonephila clavipes]|uniref:Uncharacterized protein n=1 Tax=Trichonephila clavipes TaxID=2585209 RepID=A0A8X6RF93_TRICX|nr:hypothetical protein TNCV_3412861 [Trichonephila clavipes]